MLKRQIGADLDRIDQIIDLDRYPLHEPESAAYRKLVDYCRDELAEDGCCVVERFLRPEVIEGLVTEAEGLATKAHRSSARHNPYFTEDDPALPAGHPCRTFQERTNGFVCMDLIATESPLRSVFDFEPMTQFVAHAFGKRVLYRYADPLAAMPINTMEAGDQFPWHFDTNEFTVTLVIQTSEAGGQFEYAPGIRSPAAENYEAVARVLSGDDRKVRRLDLRAGDIQLFEGRFTLHRVTRVSGTRRRHVAIPSWTARPGMVGQRRRTLEIYGRLTDVHLSQGIERHDRLAD